MRMIRIQKGTKLLASYSQGVLVWLPGVLVWMTLEQHLEQRSHDPLPRQDTGSLHRATAERRGQRKSPAALDGP